MLSGSVAWSLLLYGEVASVLPVLSLRSVLLCEVLPVLSGIVAWSVWRSCLNVMFPSSMTAEMQRMMAAARQGREHGAHTWTQPQHNEHGSRGPLHKDLACPTYDNTKIT